MPTRGAKAPTRLDRAKREAESLRAELRDIPAGAATLTDRVLPNLLPVPDRAAFDATLQDAVAIEEPPPFVLGWDYSEKVDMIAQIDQAPRKSVEIGSDPARPRLIIGRNKEKSRHARSGVRPHRRLAVDDFLNSLLGIEREIKQFGHHRLGEFLPLEFEPDLFQSRFMLFPESLWKAIHYCHREKLIVFVQEFPDFANSMQNALPVALIEPEDIANAAAWLCSDEARYITGVTLPVDAGFTVR